MTQTNDRFELQRFAGRIKIDKCYAVSKNVVYPPDIDRCRRHFKLAVQQTLVKGIRAEKSVDAGPIHPLFVSVSGLMEDGENSHLANF